MAKHGHSSGSTTNQPPAPTNQPPAPSIASGFEADNLPPRKPKIIDTDHLSIHERLSAIEQAIHTLAVAVNTDNTDTDDVRSLL